MRLLGRLGLLLSRRRFTFLNVSMAPLKNQGANSGTLLWAGGRLIPSPSGDET